MRKALRNTGRLALAFGALLALSAVALAQNQVTTGTGTLSGSVSNSVQLTSGGPGSIVGNFNGGSVADAAQGSAISATVQFGDISPNNTTAAPYVIATLPLQVRSNCNYTFNALRAGNIAASSPGTFGASDVGVTLNNFNGTGDSGLLFAGAVAGAQTGTATGFLASDGNPASTATLTNGVATYAGALNGISTSTPTALVNGTRVSNGGDNTSTNNALTFKLNFVIKPQYYTTGSGAPLAFTETLTFGIVPRP
jgi:hypothetical protein